MKCLTCYTLLADLLHIWFPSSILCCQTMLMINLIYALTSVCIFLILFFIHFLKCWQGEFVLGLKNFFSWWSFHLFSWPWYVIQGWYCKEKLNARHSKGSEVYVCSHSAVRLPISLPPSVPFQPLFLRLIHPPPFRENLGMLCTTPYSNNLVTNCKFCFVFCHALVTLNSLAKEPIPSTSSGQRKTKRIKKQKNHLTKFTIWIKGEINSLFFFSFFLILKIVG